MKPQNDIEDAYSKGYADGLNEAGLPGYNVMNPYDGRTREGKDWMRGFLAGDAERAARVKKAKAQSQDAEAEQIAFVNRIENMEPEAAQRALSGPDAVCPNWPSDQDEDIQGCGSRNVIGPDKEGLYDCLDCGLFFRAECKGRI